MTTFLFHVRGFYALAVFIVAFFVGIFVKK
jgi:hypothetical protein